MKSKIVAGCAVLWNFFNRPDGFSASLERFQGKDESKLAEFPVSGFQVMIA
jgi:hypothetical protein